MTLHKFVCPHGCGKTVELSDPNATVGHHCPMLNGKEVGLVREKGK